MPLLLPEHVTGVEVVLIASVEVCVTVILTVLLQPPASCTNPVYIAAERFVKILVVCKGPPLSEYWYGATPLPAGTLIVAVPFGCPQVAGVDIAVAFKPPVLFLITCIVSDP